MLELGLVYPMLALVLLTGGVLIVLFRSRVRMVREGLAPVSYFRVFQGSPEPEFAAKPGRHFSNLFEAPTLFYAACLTAMVAGVTGGAVLALAWGYVAMRYVHTFIHLGANRVRHRMRAYFASWLLLMAMWIYVAVEVATRS
ncbi:MAG: MAPEG family protein [Pseudomonadota bacterium]